MIFLALKLIWKALKFILLLAVLLIVAYIIFCAYSYIAYNGAAIEEIPSWVTLLLGGEEGPVFQLLFT